MTTEVGKVNLVIRADPVLLGAEQAAAICGVSRSTFLGWDAQGLIPRSVKLGGRRLWSYESLRTWAFAGCPSREEMALLIEGSGGER